MNKPKRLFTAIVVFCYAWLSMVVPLQHQDCLTQDEAIQVQSEFHQYKVAPLSTHLQRNAATRSLPSHTGHCLAFQWQSYLLSEALPAFTFHFTAPADICIITTFPRYLRMSAFSSSSRGPPLV